jgi:hypothetical protein
VYQKRLNDWYETYQTAWGPTKGCPPPKKKNVCLLSLAEKKNRVGRSGLSLFFKKYSFMLQFSEFGF